MSSWTNQAATIRVSGAWPTLPNHSAFFVDYDPLARRLVRCLLPTRRTSDEDESSRRADDFLGEPTSWERVSRAFSPGHGARKVA